MRPKIGGTNTTRGKEIYEGLLLLLPETFWRESSQLVENFERRNIKNSELLSRQVWLSQSDNVDKMLKHHIEVQGRR